jgi:formylglycine-generating enzyme required for sulfatase activity
MVKWCNARTEFENATKGTDLTPCYAVPPWGIFRYGSTPLVTCDWNATGYRLPTEAEWEKAARGGLSGQNFPWGNTISHTQANYYSSYLYIYDVSRTRGYHPTYQLLEWPYNSPVGSFAANEYGLYDMAGGVLEWCWDRFGAYSPESQIDPHGPDSGDSRVLRGGSWHDEAFLCRVASRSYNYLDGANGANGIFGFRLAQRQR